MGPRKVGGKIITFLILLRSLLKNVMIQSKKNNGLIIREGRVFDIVAFHKNNFGRDGEGKERFSNL